MTEPAARYALYFAPREHNPWWPLLSRWLGYDARTGQAVPQVAVAGLGAADLHAVTGHPRQYGAHATLKAPFRLAARATEQALLQAVDVHAQSQTAFVLPPLRVEALDRFIALVPARPDVRINRIADACTRQFDHFRAPPTEAETARRLREPLDTRALALLEKWGYPHVLERYRFHISLTGTLNGDPRRTAAEILPAARRVFAPLAGVMLSFDAISVFRQDSADAPFTLIHRAALAQ